MAMWVFPDYQGGWYLVNVWTLPHRADLTLNSGRQFPPDPTKIPQGVSDRLVPPIIHCSFKIARDLTRHLGAWVS